jgi:hypothetical protein
MGAPTFSGEKSMDTQASREGDDHRQEGLCYGAAASLAALSIEFVAKPAEAHRLHRAIPAAIRDGLDQTLGFAGCVVMISDREARLVSVVTFWSDADRVTSNSKRARWLDKLLTPYVDRRLRVRTMDAYLPATRYLLGGVIETEAIPQGKAYLQEEVPLCLA